MNRASLAETARQLDARLHTVEMGGCPRFLLAFDQGGVHIREIVCVNHVEDSVSVSGRREVHYQTYLIASGKDIVEAVKNARTINWTSER